QQLESLALGSCLGERRLERRHSGLGFALLLKEDRAAFIDERVPQILEGGRMADLELLRLRLALRDKARQLLDLALPLAQGCAVFLGEYVLQILEGGRMADLELLRLRLALCDKALQLLDLARRRGVVGFRGLEAPRQLAAFQFLLLETLCHLNPVVVA